MSSMASPLLQFANARVRIPISTRVQNSNGRYIYEEDAYKLVVCYMKRIQYSGVSSGSRKVPLPSELNGEMLPGAGGDEFYYRGYALEYSQVLSGYDWRKADITDIEFEQVLGNETFFHPSQKIDFGFGNEPSMIGTIQRSSGVFGGAGIDEIIYPAIGVQFQITGAQVLG